MRTADLNQMASKGYENFPCPLPNKRVITHRTITINGRACRVYAYDYGDGTLVWTGYRADFNKWTKIPAFTRAEERRYPARLAKLGSMLVDDLNKFKTAEGKNAFAEIAKWIESE